MCLPNWTQLCRWQSADHLQIFDVATQHFHEGCERDQENAHTWSVSVPLHDNNGLELNIIFQRVKALHWTYYSLTLVVVRHSCSGAQGHSYETRTERDLNHHPLSYWTPSSPSWAGHLLTCEAMYFSSGLSIRPMCSVAMLGGCSSVGESSLSSSFPLKLCTTHTTYTEREEGREGRRDGDEGDLINTQMEMSLQLNYGHTHSVVETVPWCRCVCNWIPGIEVFKCSAGLPG